MLQKFMVQEVALDHKWIFYYFVLRKTLQGNQLISYSL